MYLCLHLYLCLSSFVFHLSGEHSLFKNYFFGCFDSLAILGGSVASGATAVQVSSTNKILHIDPIDNKDFLCTKKL